MKKVFAPIFFISNLFIFYTYGQSNPPRSEKILKQISRTCFLLEKKVLTKIDYSNQFVNDGFTQIIYSKNYADADIIVSAEQTRYFEKYDTTRSYFCELEIIIKSKKRKIQK